MTDKKTKTDLKIDMMSKKIDELTEHLITYEDQMTEVVLKFNALIRHLIENQMVDPNQMNDYITEQIREVEPEYGFDSMTNSHLHFNDNTVDIDDGGIHIDKLLWGKGGQA